MESATAISAGCQRQGEDMKAALIILAAILVICVAM